MQRLFAEDTEWRTPAVADILPNVLQAHLDRTCFARFVAPLWARGSHERWDQAPSPLFRSFALRAFPAATIR
jgi:hypothetical protein